MLHRNLYWAYFLQTVQMALRTPKSRLIIKSYIYKQPARPTADLNEEYINVEWFQPGPLIKPWS